LHISHKQIAHRLFGHLDAVEVRLLTPHVSPYPHRVTLIGGQHIQLELLEEPANGGKAFIALAADLHGKGNELPIIEAEGNKDMSYPGHAPLRRDQIDRA